MSVGSIKVKAMKLFSRTFILLALAMGVHSEEARDAPLTIGLIGDSTVADTYGWGPAFADRFKDGITVLNYARNGATLESLSSRLDELLLLKPDYVLIQFGHNDQKKYDTEVYGTRLKSYVDRIKRAGATAVPDQSLRIKASSLAAQIKSFSERPPMAWVLYVTMQVL